jgi:hypothetical protein
MTDRLIRSQSRDRLIRSDTRSRFIRGGRGSTGVAARQGLGVALSGGPFQGGEVIDLAVLADGATLARVLFFSRSGVAGDATFDVLVDDVQVATVIVTPDSLPTKQSFVLPEAYDAAADGVVSVRLPNPPDAQLTDFLISIGS